MSETNEQDAPPALPTVPGLKVTVHQTMFNLQPVEELEATWGQPARMVKVRRLSVSEEFDLAEIGGENEGNAMWLNMAIAAASVQWIDTAPRAPWRSLGVDRGRDALRRTLDNLGRDGLRVVMMVLSGYRGEEAAPVADTDASHRAAVGN